MATHLAQIMVGELPRVLMLMLYKGNECKIDADSIAIDANIALQNDNIGNSICYQFDISGSKNVKVGIPPMVDALYHVPHAAPPTSHALDFGNIRRDVPEQLQKATSSLKMPLYARNFANKGNLLRNW